MITDKLRSDYRYYQSVKGLQRPGPWAEQDSWNGRRAAMSLYYARQAGDKQHYCRIPPGSLSYKHDGKVNDWRTREHTFIESADIGAYGLRFVGYSDKICRSIGHTGWFADSFQDETYRGCVFQLPARNGRSIYIPGYWESTNGGYIVDLRAKSQEIDSEPGGYEAGNEEARRDCARHADGMAEQSAEEAREYSESWQLGQRYAELREEARDLRKQRRALTAKLAQARRDIARLGLAFKWTRDLCQSIRDQIADLKERSRELYNEAAEILAENPYAVKEAFNDGAGYEVL